MWAKHLEVPGTRLCIGLTSDYVPFPSRYPLTPAITMPSIVLHVLIASQDPQIQTVFSQLIHGQSDLLDFLVAHKLDKENIVPRQDLARPAGDASEIKVEILKYLQAITKGARNLMVDSEGEQSLITAWSLRNG